MGKRVADAILILEEELEALRQAVDEAPLGVKERALWYVKWEAAAEQFKATLAGRDSVEHLDATLSRLYLSLAQESLRGDSKALDWIRKRPEWTAPQVRDAVLKVMQGQQREKR